MTVPVLRSRKTVYFGLLFLQFLLAAAVPYADATEEAEVMADPVHVESPADGPCRIGHDHLICQLCRAISITGTPVQRAVPLVALQARLLPSPADGTPRATTSRVALPLGPRAPPHL